MEAEMVDMADDFSQGLSRRACDQCRLRKVRCDKETPCSNCRSARRSCSSTGAGQRPKEHRQRVLISSQYERKIDQIEDRLAGIERLLQQLISTQSNCTDSSNANTVPNINNQVSQAQATYRSPVSAPSVDRPPSASPISQNRGASASVKGVEGDSSRNLFEPEDAETFEGNSSLTAHTAFASEFLANAVRKTALGDGVVVNPKFDAALNSLRQLISMQDKSRQRSTSHVWTPGPNFTNPSRSDSETTEPWAPTRKPLPRTELKDLPLPPMALVREQLSVMRHGPVPVMLAILYTFIDYDHFADRCRQLYFTTDNMSEASFIIVNAGLTYIFFEASLTAADPAKKASYEEARSMCQHNLEVALSQLNMMMPATGENIEALLMGASFCVDVSRASLAWILVSRAAHMCRTLGYHQIHTMKDDTPQTKADKSLLFWCTYMLDKALSLRLGRASVLQDYDISLPHVTPDARAAYPGKEVLTLWIQHARVLGRIYERLYSPGALRQSETARAEQVRVLSGEQTRLMEETRGLLREFETATDGEARVFALTLKSDEVSYLQSLTLTYRALPPNGPRSRTFADECIDAARASMRCHQEAIDMMGSSKSNNSNSSSNDGNQVGNGNGNGKGNGNNNSNDDQSLKIVYIHWTILYAPFIPFIVIFCLVIETSDEADLRLLGDFVRSLETACAFSASVRKLHQLCQVLYNVADLYVEAKALESSNSNSESNRAGYEFDACLSQLGLMPVDEAGLMAAAAADGLQQQQQTHLNGEDRSLAQTNQLEDWFSGKNYMMGLLEEDLSWITPTPTAWPT